MNCPRCNKPTLEEKDRDGITIDVCQLCRGIWLDRGELERLIARADQELGRDANRYDRERDDHRHQDHRDDHHKDHHSHGDHHGYEGGHHRRKSWLAELFD